MSAKVRLHRATPKKRRDQIIAIAGEAFGRDGFSATTMSTVAALVGGSKATLYKYFPSKESLFEEVMRERCQRVLAPLRAWQYSESNDLELLLSDFGIRFLTRIYERDSLDVHRLIHSEGARFPELAAIFFRSGSNVALEEIRATLERFAECGAIACDDHLLAAGQFLGMLRGDRHLRFAVGVISAPSFQEIERDALHAAKLFVRGVLEK
jgi:TetR/AcrR family transcriptional repressor of mexJK operon